MKQQPHTFQTLENPYYYGYEENPNFVGYEEGEIAKDKNATKTKQYSKSYGK